HGSVRACRLDEVLERPDGPDVVEAVSLEQGEAGRVVPAIFESLQSPQKQWLGRPAADVSDDPTHPAALLALAPVESALETPKPGCAPRTPRRVGLQPSSCLTSAAMLAQASRATSGFSA